MKVEFIFNEESNDTLQDVMEYYFKEFYLLQLENFKTYNLQKIAKKW